MVYPDINIILGTVKMEFISGVAISTAENCYSNDYQKIKGLSHNNNKNWKRFSINLSNQTIKTTERDALRVEVVLFMLQIDHNFKADNLFWIKDKSFI